MPQDQLVSLILEQYRAVQEELRGLRSDMSEQISPLREEVVAIKAQLATEEKLKAKSGTAIQGWIGIAFASLLGFASLLVSLFKHEAK